jgi:hypothetical protein
MKKLFFLIGVGLWTCGLMAQATISSPRSNKTSEKIAQFTRSFGSDDQGYYFMVDNNMNKNLLSFDKEGANSGEQSINIPMFNVSKLVTENNELRVYTYRNDGGEVYAGYYSKQDKFKKFTSLEAIPKGDIVCKILYSSYSKMLCYVAMAFVDNHYVYRVTFYDENLKKLKSELIEVGADIKPYYETVSFNLDANSNVCIEFIAKDAADKKSPKVNYLTIFNFKLNGSKRIKLDYLSELKPEELKIDFKPVYFQAPNSSYVYYIIENKVCILSIETGKLIFKGDLLSKINAGKKAGDKFRELRALAFTDEKIVGIYEDVIRGEELYRQSNAVYIGRDLVKTVFENIYIYNFGFDGKGSLKDSIVKMQDKGVRLKSFQAYFGNENGYIAFTDSRYGKSFLYNLNLSTSVLSSQVITQDDDVLYCSNMNYSRYYEKKKTSDLMSPVSIDGFEIGKSFVYDASPPTDIIFYHPNWNYVVGDYGRGVYFSPSKNKDVIGILTKNDEVAFISFTK